MTIGNKRNGWRVFDVLLGAFMLLVSFISIYPIYYIFINSLSGAAAVSAGKVVFFPIDLNFLGYKNIFEDKNIISAFFNSTFYTVAGTLINVALSAMCAYPLSRRDFYGRKTLTSIILFTMFFSGGIIPLFLTISSLNLYNTIWAVMLPSAISVYNVIVMRTFFQSIPYELTESAYIDGANDLFIFFKIILPLSAPILATMTLFYGVGNWNAFYNALMFLADKSKYPLPLILRNIVLEGATAGLQMASEASSNLKVDPRSVKYAVIAVTTLPIILVYPFVFKYFEKGVMIGSVKG